MNRFAAQHVIVQSDGSAGGGAGTVINSEIIDYRLKVGELRLESVAELARLYDEFCIVDAGILIHAGSLLYQVPEYLRGCNPIRAGRQRGRLRSIRERSGIDRGIDIEGEN